MRYATWLSGGLTKAQTGQSGPAVEMAAVAGYIGACGGEAAQGWHLVTHCSHEV